MNKFAVVCVVLGLTLSGCSASVSTADNSAPTQTAKSTPSPTPKLMTAPQASTYYLSIVCPANVAATANNNAYAGQDLAAIQATAGAARDAYQVQVKQFTDPMKVWPDVVAADIKTLVQSDFQTISIFDSISHAASLGAANAVLFPNQDAAGAAAQRIRVALGLPANTSAGC